jgi:tetratricopeptide (TPR) repeat protein
MSSLKWRPRNSFGRGLCIAIHPIKPRFELFATQPNKALEIAPNFGKAFANRGSAYMKLKDYNHAIADFTAASQPTTTRWLLERRAEAKRLSGDETGAEEDLKRASDLPPDAAR